MTTLNAIIKDWSVKVSDNYDCCLELSLTLSLQGGNMVVFSVSGEYTELCTKNRFAYALCSIMRIVGINNLKHLSGRPIRAMFKEDGHNGDIIIGLGNLLEEDWFIPRNEKLWNCD